MPAEIFSEATVDNATSPSQKRIGPMGYVIVTRNPRTKQAIAIVEGENGYDEHMAEFETEELAEQAAANTTACKAWGFQIIEIG